jgi:hypothetical protein
MTSWVDEGNYFCFRHVSIPKATSSPAASPLDICWFRKDAFLPIFNVLSPFVF